MRRTMFEAGFNSPTLMYGIAPPRQQQQLGSLWTDIKGLLTSPPAAAPAAAPAPMPTPGPDYTMIAIAGLVGLGIVGAILLSRKNAAAKPSISGRRRR